MAESHKGNLTIEEKTRIILLREAGMSSQEIAKRLGRHRRSIGKISRIPPPSQKNELQMSKKF